MDISESDLVYALARAARDGIGQYHSDDGDRSARGIVKSDEMLQKSPYFVRVCI